MLPILLAGALLVFSAWLASGAEAKTPPPADPLSAKQKPAPSSGKLTIDLRYGKKVKGLVTVSARVEGNRVVVSAEASRVSIPAIGGGRKTQVQVLVSPLCGGRFGVGAPILSAPVSTPTSAFEFSTEPVVVPARCGGKAPLGLFARAELVALAPRVVLRTGSGSIAVLAKGVSK